MNKELSTGLSSSETNAISKIRLETIKQDTHLVQDLSPISGYPIRTEEVETSIVDAASGMISELKKT